jgi:peptidoglycan/LPS O-acetylase OafA/YrhL
VSTSQRFGDTWASVILDLMRGLAAVMVLGDHWRNFFFVDFGEINLPQKKMFTLPYVLTTAGHQAVVIFFVLSGFFISGSVLRLLQSNSWTWRGYGTHRLLRLWIVVVPGLLLCAAWDGLGLSLHATRALYFGDAANHLMHDVADQRKVTYFVGNLLFLQGKSVPTFGSNAALWSLANEFWYYLLFPLALLAVWKGQETRKRVLCCLLFLAICFWLRGDFLALFPIWLAGAVISVLPRIPLWSWIRWSAVAFYVPLVLTMAVFRGFFNLLILDYLLTVATGILLWVLLSATSRAPNNLLVNAIRIMARGSFSLYILHMPVLAFVAAYLVGDARWQPTSAHVAAGMAILACTIMYSFVIAYFTEFRTDVVRRSLELNFPAMTGKQKAPSR